MKRRSMISVAAMASAAAPGLAAAQAPSPRRQPGTHPLNVRQFGAAGDGVTDDSPAIQAALDAAGAGGEVYFPDGQYMMTKVTVSSTANVTISGESWNAELIRATSNTTGLITVLGAGSLVTVLTMNGNGGAGSGENAELGLSATMCQAERVQVLNSAEVGIAVSADHCTVRNCAIVGLANAAIQSYGIWAINSNTGVMIRDNYITGTGIDGIGISGNGFQVIGNYIVNCHAYTGEGGGQLATYNNAGKTKNGLIMGNTISTGNASLSSGMELNGSDTTVIGNNVNNQKFLGIVAESGNGWIFADNTISNSGQSGTTAGYAILIDAGISNFRIGGNRLIDDQTKPTQYFGVVVSAGASNEYSITGNIITGNVGGTIQDGGTGLNKLIRDNTGIDDVIPTIAAAATLTLPLNPVFTVAGEATVTAFSGPHWTGRTVTILPESNLNFVAGSSIANGLDVTGNTPVTAIYNGRYWFLR